MVGYANVWIVGFDDDDPEHYNFEQEFLTISDLNDDKKYFLLFPDWLSDHQFNINEVDKKNVYCAFGGKITKYEEI